MGLSFQILLLSLNILYLYSVDSRKKEVLKYDIDDNYIKKSDSQQNDTLKQSSSDNDTRRQVERAGDSSIYSSSSQELPNFKKEWKETYWLKKQIDIRERQKNKSFVEASTDPDMVYMIAARPWGVRCGDPSMHDMPSGTCMLPMECEAEFRIWRGDQFCGRTQFVCCGIEETSYDLYKGFDASFASSFETDSEERKQRDDAENKKEKKSVLEKKRRQKDRKERKRIMKKKIQQIVSEVQKLLNRIYRNGTKEKHKKTKQMKHFIKELKTRYKKDRQAMKDIHEIEFIKIDARLRNRLEEIRLLNENFMNNDTFREIILNGTITLNSARMLVEAYPELESYFGTRRSMSKSKSKPDYLNYDVEYGLLYY